MPATRELRLTRQRMMDQEVVDAKSKEHDNLIRNNVYTEVPLDGQKVISTRWVFTEKIVEGKKTIKARLVARGFEEDSDSLGVRTDSPTCTRHSLKFVMMTAAIKGWKIKSLDVSSAFFQGNQLDRDVFIKPPSELCDGNKV